MPHHDEGTLGVGGRRLPGSCRQRLLGRRDDRPQRILEGGACSDTLCCRVAVPEGAMGEYPRAAEKTDCARRRVTVPADVDADDSSPVRALAFPEGEAFEHQAELM